MVKNANGSGSIKRREDGRWEGRLMIGFDPKTGKVRRKSVYGKTQKEARQKLTELAKQVDDGTYTEPLKMTLQQWLEVWLKEYNGNIKPYSYRTYSDRIRLHIVPALGRLKLQALNAPTVQRFINWMKDGDKETAPLSPKTVKSVHGVLHKALQQALILGYIKTNPADHCTLPRIVRKQFKPLDENSTVPFLDAIHGDRYENLFVVDLFTGLRFGEILGLKWENIDFRTGIITVTQQLQHEKKSGGTNYLTSLKNNKTRQIQVAETVLQALREEQKQQLLFRMATGRDWAEPIPGLVFTGDRGAPISQSAVRRHFKSIAERIGLPDLRFHDLRHSFAVASLQNGDDVKTVQENLGHHSASFTLDVYGHVTDKMRQDSAERMENYIKALRG